MGHVDVGVTQNAYGESRCKEEARAVWLTPHFFAIRRKVFHASGAEPVYQQIKKENAIRTRNRAYA